MLLGFGHLLAIAGLQYYLVVDFDEVI